MQGSQEGKHANLWGSRPHFGAKIPMKIAETDEGDGSGSAQLEGSPFSYIRKDQIWRNLVRFQPKFKQFLKTKRLEIHYHEGNAHIPYMTALNRNWKNETN